MKELSVAPANPVPWVVTSRQNPMSALAIVVARTWFEARQKGCIAARREPEETECYLRQEYKGKIPVGIPSEV